MVNTTRARKKQSCTYCEAGAVTAEEIEQSPQVTERLPLCSTCHQAYAKGKHTAETRRVTVYTVTEVYNGVLEKVIPFATREAAEKFEEDRIIEEHGSVKDYVFELDAGNPDTIITLTETELRGV